MLCIFVVIHLWCIVILPVISILLAVYIIYIYVCKYIYHIIIILKGLGFGINQIDSYVQYLAQISITYHLVIIQVSQTSVATCMNLLCAKQLYIANIKWICNNSL